MQEICPTNPGLEETAQRNLNLGPREFDRGGVVSETPVKTRPAAEMRSGSVQNLNRQCSDKFKQLSSIEALSTMCCQLNTSNYASGFANRDMRSLHHSRLPMARFTG